MVEETDPTKLFRAFASGYDYHDAESVFPWASKWLHFSDIIPKPTLSKGPFWVKGPQHCTLEWVFILIWNEVFFLNLAVQTKLFIYHPHSEETCRAALLRFYDEFPYLPKYAFIKPRHFRLRPRRPRKPHKRVPANPIVEYGALDNELESASEATPESV